MSVRRGDQTTPRTPAVTKQEYAAMSSTESDSATDVDAPSETGGDDVVGAFKDAADEGELDLYTCWALSNASDAKSDATRSITIKIFKALACQVIVPAALLLDSLESVDESKTKMSVVFHIVAFVLYMYSLEHLHEQATDEGREIFLRVCFDYSLDARFLFPAILGELINSFIFFTLSVSLFKLFASSGKNIDLILNATAINFIGNVDNDFVTKKESEIAVRQLTEAVQVPRGMNRRASLALSAPKRGFFQALMVRVCFFLRVGTLCVGIFLAAVLLFSYKDYACSHWTSLTLLTVCPRGDIYDE